MQSDNVSFGTKRTYPRSCANHHHLAEILNRQQLTQSGRQLRGPMAW